MRSLCADARASASLTAGAISNRSMFSTWRPDSTPEVPCLRRGRAALLGISDLLPRHRGPSGLRGHPRHDLGCLPQVLVAAQVVLDRFFHEVRDPGCELLAGEIREIRVEVAQVVQQVGRLEDLALRQSLPEHRANIHGYRVDFTFHAKQPRSRGGASSSPALMHGSSRRSRGKRQPAAVSGPRRGSVQPDGAVRPAMRVEVNPEGAPSFPLFISPVRRLAEQ